MCDKDVENVYLKNFQRINAFPKYFCRISKVDCHINKNKNNSDILLISQFER